MRPKITIDVQFSEFESTYENFYGVDGAIKWLENMREKVESKIEENKEENA